jgi:uncharacterized protein (TIGR02145 family)
MCKALSQFSTCSLHFVITSVFLILQQSPIFSQQINDGRPEILINTSEERGDELKIKFEIKGPENKKYNLIFYIAEAGDYMVPKYVIGNITNLNRGIVDSIIWQYRKEGFYDLRNVQYKLEIIPNLIKSGSKELRVERLGCNYWTIDDINFILDSNSNIGYYEKDKAKWGKLFRPGYFVGNSVDTNLNLLFNSYALKGDSLVCPRGWRVPTVKDFSELVVFLNEPAEYFLTQDYHKYNKWAGIGNNWFVGSSQRGCLSPFGSEDMVEENWLWWTKSQSSVADEGLVYIFDSKGKTYSASVSKNAGIHVRCVCSIGKD